MLSITLIQQCYHPRHQPVVSIFVLPTPPSHPLSIPNYNRRWLGHNTMRMSYSRTARPTARLIQTTCSTAVTTTRRTLRAMTTWTACQIDEDADDDASLFNDEVRHPPEHYLTSTAKLNVEQLRQQRYSSNTQDQIDQVKDHHFR
jgi:hypothetical protein